MVGMGLDQRRQEFRIITRPDSTTIEVDGEDVSSKVHAARLDLDSRGATLTLAGPAAGEIDGVALVQVESPSPPGEQVAAFLGGIDPAELERVALNREDMETHGLTKAMLNQLAEWAVGRG